MFKMPLPEKVPRQLLRRVSITTQPYPDQISPDMDSATYPITLHRPSANFPRLSRQTGIAFGLAGERGLISCLPCPCYIGITVSSLRAPASLRSTYLSSSSSSSFAERLAFSFRPTDRLPQIAHLPDSIVFATRHSQDGISSLVTPYWLLRHGLEERCHADQSFAV